MSDTDNNGQVNKLDKILTRLDELERGQEIVYEQLAALMNLHTVLAPLNAPLPRMRRWAAAPDFAILLYELLIDHQPTTVVELGSGVTTVVSGYYMLRHGKPNAQIYAVEQDALYASLAREKVERHQLQDYATVVHASLETLPLVDDDWEWYDQAVFADIEQIDFLTVDGPAQNNNPRRMVRYPALPVLFEKLAPQAIILVDDAHREHETWVIRRWMDEFDLLELARVDTEKGAVVLQKNR
ncbi:MAG: class I SAM-dependent methyltransferase [Chloroflexota bacterium]